MLSDCRLTLVVSGRVDHMIKYSIPKFHHFIENLEMMITFSEKLTCNNEEYYVSNGFVDDSVIFHKNNSSLPL